MPHFSLANSFFTTYITYPAMIRVQCLTQLKALGYCVVRQKGLHKFKPQTLRTATPKTLNNLFLGIGHHLLVT